MPRLVIVLLFAAVGVRLTMQFLVDGYADAESAALQIQKEKIDSERHGMKQFQSELRETIGDLTAESISLAGAVDRIEQSARTHYPKFFEQIQLSAGKGLSLRARIAQNAILHVESRLKDTNQPVGDSQLLDRLQTERAAKFPG